MRTSIDIDDALMSKAMQAGPYRTKKVVVEAGLKLLARRVVYREILKWQGKLKWEGDESIDWTQPPASDAPNSKRTPRSGALGATGATVLALKPVGTAWTTAKTPAVTKDRPKR